ncbi:uncharacterized protein TNCV_4454341 [Trichonephila clavipes]|nr:uncharacterized protein TNCV_4454341 [Trichonephila clavipes]
MKRDVTSMPIIQEKAREIFEKLKEQTPGSLFEELEFKATTGWFTKFERSGINPLGVCAPSIKDYLDTNDLPLKALLLLDNAPGHPKDLKDNLLTDFLADSSVFTSEFADSADGSGGDTPEIMDEILTTARDLELEVNEDNIEELIMGHEDELTTEELQEILNEEHQETQRNVSPS